MLSWTRKLRSELSHRRRWTSNTLLALYVYRLLQSPYNLLAPIWCFCCCSVTWGCHVISGWLQSTRQDRTMNVNVCDRGYSLKAVMAASNLILFFLWFSHGFGSNVQRDSTGWTLARYERMTWQPNDLEIVKLFSKMYNMHWDCAAIVCTYG